MKKEQVKKMHPYLEGKMGESESSFEEVIREKCIVG